MIRSALLILFAGVFLSTLILLDHSRTRSITAATRQAARRESQLPVRIAWVWERPEDLHQLDPASEGVAILKGTLHLDSTATFTPRRNSVLLPQETVQIAVVRIETGPTFGKHHHDTALFRKAEELLSHSVSEPGIAGLQIDFDARRSERAFYRRLLESLRGSMPASLPLDITALVSWCAEDDWIAGLPVNSATPMFFRMEPGRARASQTARLSAALPEPLCQNSVGVSSREPWPTDIESRRLYVFADRGWRSDLPFLDAKGQRP